MLLDLRTAPTNAPLDANYPVTENSAPATSAYALAMNTDGSRGKTFSLFGKSDFAMFIASAVMMLLPLIGGYYFDR
jgi:hypothetical protein